MLFFSFRVSLVALLALPPNRSASPEAHASAKAWKLGLDLHLREVSFIGVFFRELWVSWVFWVTWVFWGWRGTRTRGAKEQEHHFTGIRVLHSFSANSFLVPFTARR